MDKTAVLAYSGGLDTSCAIAWLKEDYGYDEVIAVLVDVGQQTAFEPAFERGYAAGASEVMLIDRRDDFADEQVAKAIQANALYEGKYPLRFELAFKARYPGVRVIAPLRDRIWSRDEEIAYAESRGIPVEAKQESPYSIDDNLFGRAIEAGMHEDPWVAPPEEAFALTSSPADAPAPIEIVVGFEAGVPVSLDGEELPLAELIAVLNAQAGPYGIGRIDMVENRAIGIKSRELYEAPAALTLIPAHQALEDLVLTKAEAIAKRQVEAIWAKTVYDGLWFSPAS